MHSFWELLATTKDQCDYFVREIKRFINNRVTDQCVLKMRLLFFELHAALLLVGPVLSDEAALTQRAWQVQHAASDVIPPQQLARQIVSDEEILGIDWTALDSDSW